MKLLQSILFLLTMGLAVVAQALDQDVQVDLLMSKIITADKEGRAADALPSFVKLESMEPTLKKPLSEGFHYLYINTLDGAGDHVNALRRANIYMEKFGKRGNNYPKVIEIMSRLQDQVAKEERDAREKKEREEREAAASAEAERVRQKDEREGRSPLCKDIANKFKALRAELSRFDLVTRTDAERARWNDQNGTWEKEKQSVLNQYKENDCQTDL
jgi:hypothetical protein